MNIESQTQERRSRPFRKAVLAGLAILMPPLLTIVLFLWAWNAIEGYVLMPLEGMARYAILISIQEIKAEPPDEAAWVDGEGRRPNEVMDTSGRLWVKVRNKYIPFEVYDYVETHLGAEAPGTATAYYYRYIDLRYLQRQVVIPVFLLLFVLVLYLLGKFIAAGIGRILWNSVERLIARLPIISNVYSSVKQVTDFAFRDSEIEFTRIVAVEYPRKGIWSMGFVTGEGMLDVRNAANEPVVSVLMPTSPMPATGFTIIVPKSETIDLNITIDQAIQFCVSCGVVIPPQQQWRELESKTRGMGSLETSAAVRAAIQLQIENAQGRASTESPSVDEGPNEPPSETPPANDEPAPERDASDEPPLPPKDS